MEQKKNEERKLLDTYEEYKARRRGIRHDMERMKDYHKGNLVQSLNLCSLCGRPLSQLRLEDFKMVAVENYTRFASGMIHVSMCDNPKRCYKKYTERGGK